MIQGIFYARFFPKEGTKIVAQSPPGCIVPVPVSSTTPGATPTTTTSTPTAPSAPSAPGAGPATATTTTAPTPASRPPLFDFDVMQEYVIPRPAFFNRFVTALDPAGRYAVLGFPVCIPHPKYDRNEFIFNFGVVVEAAEDAVPYERVVRRLAATFAEMEVQSGYLSQPVAAGTDGGRRPIESLLEIIKEDLNLYGECMIPVDDANTINMKLFPHHANPPQVKGWHVPVAKMKLADIVDPTWDLTLQKVIAHIDGVSDVRRIAFEADVSLELAQAALRHLLYYDTVLLLDMFFFGSCYAPRPQGVHDFVANVGGVVDECAAYVCCCGPPAMAAAAASAGGGGGGGGVAPASSVGEADRGGSSVGGGAGANTNNNNNNAKAERRPQTTQTQTQQQRVSNYDLIRLMTSFCAGRTVMEWLRGHREAGFDVLRYVDVRRLVQFGVIKGCLYRVHKYVVSKQYLAALVTGQARPGGGGGLSAVGGGGAGGGAGGTGGGGDPLQKYTDGRHCFDQIITEQNLTDAQILERLKSFRPTPGDLTVFYR